MSGWPMGCFASLTMTNEWIANGLLRFARNDILIVKLREIASSLRSSQKKTKDNETGKVLCVYHDQYI